MSDILNKISSIEPEDDAVAKRLGLRPAEDDILEIPETKTETSEKLELPARNHRNDTDPIPAFITGEPSPTPVETRMHFGWTRWVLFGFIAVWLLASVAMLISVGGLGGKDTSLSMFQWAGFGLIACAPICLAGLFWYALTKLAEITNSSLHLRETAETLLSPDHTAKKRATLLAQHIRNEIESLNHHVDIVLSRTSKLRESLDEQIQAISRTTYITENKTDLIAGRLVEERQALVSIATTFDERMNSLSNMLGTHSADLARSTQEAEQKIQEARISVEGVAAKITTASEIVRGNTVEAASNLEANQQEISRLGNDLKVRAQELDGVYRKHAYDLAAMISDLREEQENIGTSLDARLQKMRDMSLSAQVSAGHLTDASEAGRQTVEALADAARLTDSAVKKRFSEMEDMVKYSNARAENISETAARRVQDSLAQTRKEISRIEGDMMALQDKLTDTSDLNISQSQAREPQFVPEKIAPEPAPKKRRGILGLRPAPEENTSEQRRIIPDEAPINLRGLKSNLSTENETASPPVPSPPMQRIEPVDELEIPSFKSSSASATPHVQPPLPRPTPDPVQPLAEERDPNTLELEFKIPDASDLVSPNPDEDLTTFDPDLLRRAVPEDKSARNSQTESDKASWWKGLFGTGKKQDTLAIDALTAPTAGSVNTNSNIISALSALGLSPSAVVDDGCIIEAVNSRVSKGPLAMSEVIMLRLDDPVRHLHQSVQADLNLKEAITAFARDFHTNLGPIEDNREAIRTRLESDEGRAFLLCDAALNM